MIPARWTQRIAHGLLFLATLAVLLPVLGILGGLVWKAMPALSWEFVTQRPREGNRAGGIMPAIVGTLILVTATVAIALPIGVAAAIYLHEYARDTRFTRLIRLTILNLAGVPSIVHGLFGLALFVLLLDFGTSILAGSATLAILILPLIISASEEALRAVPDTLREASFALGATRWQTVWRAVVPNAMPGILTGAILGVGRAAGETAPILFTVAAFGLRDLPDSPFDQVMALPYHLYIMATQVTKVPEALPYAIATVLIGVVIVLNVAAIVVRARFRYRARAH